MKRAVTRVMLGRMEQHKGLPALAFATKAALARWLRSNHAKVDGLWIELAKKGSGVASVTYEEAREVAIAYGWIDGLKNSKDETFFRIRFTPRRARSKWSKINREIAEELMSAGEMKPAGLAEVEAAKADGRWAAAYDSPSKIQPHPDFARALERSPKAKAFFATISGANRYAFLYRVLDAKREETRKRRIEQFVAMLERGEVLHPGG
jgi:uncharacterized protein YdeI (YjbR/CyaY-like superfamily)